MSLLLLLKTLCSLCVLLVLIKLLNLIGDTYTRFIDRVVKKKIIDVKEEVSNAE